MIGDSLQQTLLLLFVLVLFVVAWYELIPFLSGLKKRFRSGEAFLDAHLFKRFHSNPILSPSLCYEWQENGVLNPSAYRDKDGSIHLIYRAVGKDGISRFGYAKSKDSFVFDTHVPYPIFSLHSRYGGIRPEEYNRSIYTSGGSWGGCEDPRVVEIDGRIYMTFNVFGGWDYIRTAVASISVEDLLAQRWNWSKTTFLSPLGEVNKNWLLFPEKIHGQFAILHSINPTVEVEFVEALELLDSGARRIKSVLGPRVAMKARKTWDTWPRSASAPPIKTKQGWLVLYHANTKEDPHKYQVGALLLDLDDPTRIRARAPAALIIPNEWYENDWKPGIIYMSGAVVDGDDLIVYYGGGDRHICTARTSLSALLAFLESNASLEP